MMTGPTTPPGRGNRDTIKFPTDQELHGTPNACFEGNLTVIAQVVSSCIENGSNLSDLAGERFLACRSRQLAKYEREDGLSKSLSRLKSHTENLLRLELVASLISRCMDCNDEDRSANKGAMKKILQALIPSEIRNRYVDLSLFRFSSSDGTRYRGADAAFAQFSSELGYPTRPTYRYPSQLTDDQFRIYLICDALETRIRYFSQLQEDAFKGLATFDQALTFAYISCLNYLGGKLD